MTDNQGLLPNNIGITSDLLYNLKPSSGRGRSYRCTVQPTNASTFLPQSTTVMYIPCGRKNTFLDPQQSYLKYTILNYDTTGAIRCDGTAASFINRIDTFHASNMLESIQQYNVLYNFLTDFQIDGSSKTGLSNIMGYDGDNISNIVSRDGAIIALASGATTPTKLTVCLPVLSGVWGMLLDKQLCVGALNDDIRVEITWESLTQGCMYVAAATGTSWQITNVELELCYVELQDDSMNIVNSVSNLNSDLFLHGKSWRHYVSTLPSGTAGTYSALVPQRFASSCGLVCLPRRSVEIAGTYAINSYSTSSRINPNIDSYWWRLGSLLIPQKYVVLKNSSATTGSVGGYGEAFMELQKFFHSMNQPEYSGSLPFSYYNVADNATADASVGQGGIVAPTGANTAATQVFTYKQGFAIAQNLETYSQKSDVIISGMNTLSAQTFFECNIGTATAASYTLDFYALYDHILVKDSQGILSVRF